MIARMEPPFEDSDVSGGRISVCAPVQNRDSAGHNFADPIQVCDKDKAEAFDGAEMAAKIFPACSMDCSRGMRIPTSTPIWSTAKVLSARASSALVTS